MAAQQVLSGYRFLVIVCFASVLLLGSGWAFLLACALVRGSRQPEIALPEAMLELGEGVPGEVLHGTFWVKNSGHATLSISGLETGCGCAAADLSNPILAAGEQAFVSVTVRIKQEGQHLQFPVRIFSDDPKTPVVEQIVRADAGPPVLRTEPAELDFGEICRGSTPEQLLLLRKPDGKPWPVDEPVVVETRSGQVRAEVVRQAEASVLRVHPLPELTAEAFADTLILKPANSSRTVQVAIRGRVVPQFVVSPTTLYFGDVDPRKVPMKRYVLLRRTDGKPWKRVVRCTAPAALRLEEADSATSTGAQRAQRLQVTLDVAQVKQDVKDGIIALWLEDEPEPVTIRVLVFLAQKG